MLNLTRPEGSEPEDFHLSRRAIGAAVFAGYAVAALGAEAEPIHTDEAGLTTGMVAIPNGASAPLPAYVARPQGKGRHPTVIVVNEIFGIHEYIRDTCRRFAKLGFVAVAPAFFYRAGDPAPLTDMGEIRKIVATATNAQVMGDIGATLKWLKAQPFVAADKLAITGFCWGGGVVWMACESFTEFKAGVAWYGQLARPDKPSASDPDRKYPIELAGQLHAPVLGLYAGKDGLTQAVPAMREALKAAGKTGSEIVVYDDAQHGFHADYRPSYNEADAKDGWAKLLAHFARNGVKP